MFRQNMRLAILTNILTPYRIPLFEHVSKRVQALRVFLMAEREENRSWMIPAVELDTETLSGVHLKLYGSDTSVHINYGVIRALRHFKPDIILSGGFGPANITALFYCKLASRPFVHWAHLHMRDGAERSITRRWLRHAMIRLADGAVAESSDARDAFVHYGAHADHVLTALMPLDVAHFHDRTAEIRKSPEGRALRDRLGKAVILSIGQLIRRKGIDELFEIYEAVLTSRPDASLLIIGEGPERAKYERRAFERGWQQVHFVGYVQTPDLPKYLAASDVFLFPTLFDPFGLVLSEAMAAELPVVSSIFASSTRDLVVDGMTGFAIDPTHSRESADAVLRLLAMTDWERSAMGRAGYERVRSADAQTSAERIVGFLQMLIDARGPTTAAVHPIR